MRRFFFIIFGFLTISNFCLAGCAPGVGSSGIAPVPGAGPAPSIMGAKVVGNTVDGSSAGTPQNAAAAAGGSDMMPPPSDGEKMPATAPTKAAWRITYFSTPATKVPGGYSDAPSVIYHDGTASLDSKFLVEVGVADWDCGSEACWHWSPASEDQFVRIKLTRGAGDTSSQYYQDIRIGSLQTDGSNLKVSGMPVLDGDLLYFAYTGSSQEPLGYSSVLAELIDGVQKFGGTVDLGYFQVEPRPVYRRMEGAHLPSFDLEIR